MVPRNINTCMIHYNLQQQYQVLVCYVKSYARGCPSSRVTIDAPSLDHIKALVIGGFVSAAALSNGTHINGKTQWMGVHKGACCDWLHGGVSCPHAAKTRR